MDKLGEECAIGGKPGGVPGRVSPKVKASHQPGGSLDEDRASERGSGQKLKISGGGRLRPTFLNLVTAAKTPNPVKP